MRFSSKTFASTFVLTGPQCTFVLTGPQMGISNGTIGLLVPGILLFTFSVLSFFLLFSFPSSFLFLFFLNKEPVKSVADNTFKLLT